MSLQALFAFGVIYFNVESTSVPGADEDPGRSCTWIEGLEVTFNRLADAGCDMK